MGMRNNKRNNNSGGLPHPPRRQTDTRDEIGENMKIENEVKCGWMSTLGTLVMESLATGAGDPGYGVFGDAFLKGFGV